MPTFKKSLHKNGKYSESQLQQAVKNVVEKGMSLRQAAREFEIPRTTLRTYVNLSKQAGDSIVKKKHGYQAGIVNL